ncbi:MAG: aconitate hydratase [Gammaproteobacteria bacterium]|jgi:aconitate hydratase|nr:aconitate hydratase [Gammaproteobacteria bacterium]
MTARNLTHKLIHAHHEGDLPAPGEPLPLTFDQTLTQDATGTLVMLLLEAIGLERTRAELSAQYVDHNLIQQDHKNPDDHRFLLSAARRFGLWYSRPGNGVSHPVHMMRFGAPGKTLIGSDSHTPAAGSLGMFAVGAGGGDVAMAIAGERVAIPMPEVWGVELTGELPDWVSAKDVILELLRRHDVDGGRGRVVEYYGDGVAKLAAMDRHVICNMGTELGAITSVFPADDEVRRFLDSEDRGDEFEAWAADEGCDYDHHEHIDLSALEPLIARPSSPGNVVPVREVAGESIYQAYVGSSANPGYRDFAVAADMVAGRTVAEGVSFDVNPTSRQVLRTLIRDGRLDALVAAGARLHQAGCNGCIGMGQAPANEGRSLRTVPRNFPGRSGTREDRVYLCSPETATASALTGEITDPRTLDMDYPRISPPQRVEPDRDLLVAPLPAGGSESGSRGRPALEMGPNIEPLPELEPPPDEFDLPVLLVMGDDVSTDEILPGGLDVLPLRSNVPGIARYCFERIDQDYPDRAEQTGDHAVVGGKNYGQGSSREHAALAPRHLGLRVAVAKSFARIHRQNLANYGVLPLTFDDPDDYEALAVDDVLHIEGVHAALDDDQPITARCAGKDGEREVKLQHGLSPHQREVIRAGGLINWLQNRD